MNWIALLIITLTLIGVAIGRFPLFRLNRATIALVGASLLVVANVITLEQAYHAIDFNTIALLFAMMVLNINLRLAGFFNIVSSRIVRSARSPKQLLYWLIFASGILSSLFLNDTIVLVFTPLVLEVVLGLKRNPIPYLLALATAANVGSAATIVGNPQNMIIGVFSQIPFARFALILTPVAFVGLWLIGVIIVWFYPKEFSNAPLPVIPETKPPRHFKPLLYKSLVAISVMIVAFFAGAPIPVAALGSATLLLITRRVKSERVFIELGWSLLMFFSGLFIVTHAFNSLFFSHLQFSLAGRDSLTTIFNLSVISTILSNLISNVPAVLLLGPVVTALPQPEMAWLTLAMATTFAGNLTLLGSVANIIVAESARRQGVTLSFLEYLKVGLPIAVLTLVLGIVWLALVF
jgi:Na+/H+ antiporter NhaD/arsenite permease-like protein